MNRKEKKSRMKCSAVISVMILLMVKDIRWIKKPRKCNKHLRERPLVNVKRLNKVMKNELYCFYSW